MGWQRVELAVDGALAEALCEALEEAGAVSTEITDADAGTPAESAVYGEPGAQPGPWPRCRIAALFPQGIDAQALAQAAMRECGLDDRAALSVAPVEEADWVARTQQLFEPIRAGERLWIVPSWHAQPDPHAVNIVLDPGGAFGTGSHATTRLCLAWLERQVRPGDRVLDYGCGSGILGIAALKLGASSATGVDVDPLALEAARYNSGRNGVALAVADARQAVAGEARITIANILANPLRMLAPVLASHTQPGGWIALSGILEDQAREVAAAYAPWADLEIDSRAEGWVLLTGRKRPC